MGRAVPCCRLCPHCPYIKPATTGPVWGVLPTCQAECYGYFQFPNQLCKLYITILILQKKTAEDTEDTCCFCLLRDFFFFFLVIAPWFSGVLTPFHLGGLTGLHSSPSLPSDRHVIQAGPTWFSFPQVWMLRGGRQRWKMFGSGSSGQH